MTGPDLAAALAALGMSKEAFAERFGINNRVTVARWLNGERRVPAWVPRVLELLHKNGAEAVDEDRSDA